MDQIQGTGSNDGARFLLYDIFADMCMCYRSVCGLAAACQDGFAAEKHEVHGSCPGYKPGDYYRKTGTRVGRTEEAAEWEEYV